MQIDPSKTTGSISRNALEQAPTVMIKASRLPLSVYLGSAFVNFLGLALPLTILHVYDRVLPNQAFDTLAMLVTGLIGVVILDSILRIGRGAIMGWRAAAYGHNKSMDAMARLMASNAHQLQNTKGSSIISQLQSLSDMAEFQGSTARLLLIDIAWVPVFAIVITVIAGPLIVVPTAFLIAFVVYISFQTRRLRKIIEKREEVEERKYDFYARNTANHADGEVACDGTFDDASVRTVAILQQPGASEERPVIANHRASRRTVRSFNDPGGRLLWRAHGDRWIANHWRVGRLHAAIIANDAANHAIALFLDTDCSE